MFLTITFPNEIMPFFLHSSEKEIVRAINKAKELGCRFDDKKYTITDDNIVLHSINTIGDKFPSVSQQRRIKRLYCFNDKIILQTDALCPDEIEPTRELLAYEKGINKESICVVEI